MGTSPLVRPQQVPAGEMRFAPNRPRSRCPAVRTRSQRVMTGWHRRWFVPPYTDQRQP